MKHIYLNGVIVDNFQQLMDFGWDSFDWNSLETIQDKFSNIPETEKEVKLHLNCIGGSVDAGFKIYDFLQTQKTDFGRTIHTVADGACASMGSIIFLAADKENRSITSNAKVMIHLPLVGMQGNSVDLHATATELEAENERFAQFYATRTVADKDELLAMMTAETEIDADKCVELGFASKKIETIKAVALFNYKSKSNNKMNELAEKMEKAVKALSDATARILGNKKPEKLAVDVTGTDGTRIEAEGEELSIGMTVTVYQADAVVENFSGEVTLENGTVIMITENVIESITEAESPVDVEALKSENEALKAELEELKGVSTVALQTIETYTKGIGKKLNLSGGVQKFVKATPEIEEAKNTLKAIADKRNKKKEAK